MTIYNEATLYIDLYLIQDYILKFPKFKFHSICVVHTVMKKQILVTAKKSDSGHFCLQKRSLCKIKMHAWWP